MAAVLCRPCTRLAVSCLTSYRSSLASSALSTRPPCCSSDMPMTVLGVFRLLLTLPGLYILLMFKWLAPSPPSWLSSYVNFRTSSLSTLFEIACPAGLNTFCPLPCIFSQVLIVVSLIYCSVSCLLTSPWICHKNVHDGRTFSWVCAGEFLASWAMPGL